VVAALLEAGEGEGALLERRTKRGDTALRLGATKGHLAACRALVAAGADPLAANQVRARVRVGVRVRVRVRAQTLTLTLIPTPTRTASRRCAPPG